MVLGLRYGRNSPDQAAKARIYAQIQEFADRFNARNASLTCKGLLGVDISTPEGHELARKKQLFTTTCPRFVRDAAEVLEEMMASPQA